MYNVFNIFHDDEFSFYYHLCSLSFILSHVKQFYIHVDVVVQIYTWFKFYLCIVLGYDNI